MGVARILRVPERRGGEGVILSRDLFSQDSRDSHCIATVTAERALQIPSIDPFLQGRGVRTAAEHGPHELSAHRFSALVLAALGGARWQYDHYQ